MARRKKVTIFKDGYDVPIPFQRTWDTLLEGSGWKQGDGDLPGHFRDKSPGHMCLWSCKWHTGTHGIIRPDDYAGLDYLSEKAFVLEALDFSRRGDGLSHKRVSEHMLDYLSGIVPNVEQWRSKVATILRSVREAYTEYAAPWDMPLPGEHDHALMMLITRPGWFLRHDYVKALRQGASVVTPAPVDPPADPLKGREHLPVIYATRKDR